MGKISKSWFANYIPDDRIENSCFKLNISIFNLFEGSEDASLPSNIVML